MQGLCGFLLGAVNQTRTGDLFLTKEAVANSQTVGITVFADLHKLK